MNQIVSKYYSKERVETKEERENRIKNYILSFKNFSTKFEEFKFDTLESVLDLINKMDTNGIPFEDSLSILVDGDKATFDSPKSRELMFSLINLKSSILYMDRTNISKEDLVYILKFFRYIPNDMQDISDGMIEDKFNLSKLLVDLTPCSVKESTFKFDNETMQSFVNERNSLLEEIESLYDNKYFSTFRGRTFKNMFGNHIQALEVKIDYRDSLSKFNLYIPMEVNGIYTLGTNEFIYSKSFENFYNDRRDVVVKTKLRLLFNTLKSIIKYYSIDEYLNKILRRYIQIDIFNIFYSKVNVKATYTIENKDRLENEAAMQKLSLNDYLKKFDYSFVPFVMTKNRTDSMTDFEIFVEHHKCYFRDYTNDIISGKDILKRMKNGLNGYDKNKNIPLNNEYVTHFDVSYINNTGNFLVAWTNKNKLSLAEICNPLWLHNLQTFRDGSAPFITGHAINVGVVEMPITNTLGTEDMIIPPSVNEWWLYLDYTNDLGQTTFDGNRLYAKKGNHNNLYFNGAKTAFRGFDKGVGVMNNDNLYFMLNGEKIYLNVFSPLNISSRKNKSVLYEGLYNAKKMFEGKDEVEYRDFIKNPLNKKLELLKSQRIYKESVDGKEDEYLGKHFIGYMPTYFVRELDGSFVKDDLSDENNVNLNNKSLIKKYKMSTEILSRLFFMGGKELYEELLGTEEEINDKVSSIYERENIKNNNGEFSRKKIFGKRGEIITNVFQRKVEGFTATVIPNNNLKDEVRIVTNEVEFKALLITLIRVYPNMNIPKLLLEFNKGKEILISESALGMRNPSVDDANAIYQIIKVIKYSGEEKYFRNSYVEVNPILWSRQGGDFDGDTIILLFFRKIFKDQLHDLFKYSNHSYSKSFEYKLKEIFGDSNPITISKQYSDGDADTFLRYLHSVKGKGEIDFSVMTREEAISKMSSTLITTKISKQLISVSKTITIKFFMFMEAIVRNTLVSSDETFKIKLGSKVRELCDLMNYELVQPTIDIQKWSDNLTKVIETVLLVYKTSETISLLMEGEVGFTGISKMIFTEHAIKNGYISIVRNQEGKFLGYKTNENKVNNNSLFDLIFNSIDLDKVYEETFNYNLGVTLLKYRKGVKIFDYNDYDFKKILSYIDLDGEIYKKIVEETKSEMEGVDIDKLFYIK